ncbi:unnamed protein product [Leptosia nina]|uniref:unspecific monooxygenase n=1 Tax=Leptosia nina TaxID=320188 RepID=A0AAV1JCN8_9NEOP
MRKSFWDYFYELKQKCPYDCVGIYLGLQPGLVVQSPDLARKVIVDSDCFPDRFTYSGSNGDPIGSLNLFASKGKLRKYLQQVYSPIFTTVRLKKLTQLMTVNGKDLTDKIQRDFVDNKKRVNLKELMAMYVSDTLAFSVFGIKLSVLKGEDSPLWHITKHITKCDFSRGFEIIVNFLHPESCKTFAVSSKNAQITLKLKDNMSENLMLAQTGTFIMASAETSSVALTYCLFELAYHQEEQEILYNEIEEALRKSGKDILEYNDFLELKYLTAVINETLRKSVPLQHLDRVPVRDYQLTDNITIEKGIPVLINVLALHHDERYFPEPNEWRPERFLTSSEYDNLHYSFIPFGEGHRACIGKRYGMLQLKIALSQIVHKFKIEPVMPYKLKSDPYSIVLAPIDGASVKFVPR